MTQQQNNVEHSPTYEIAYQAGADLAVVIPDLPSNIVVREAYRYHRSVSILNLPFDECIEAYAAGYETGESKLTQQDGKDESDSFQIAYQAGIDESKETPGLSDSAVVRKALQWYEETSKLMALNLSEALRGYQAGYHDHQGGIV